MKNNSDESRTDDLYEILDAYPKPPLPSVADINDPKSFSDVGIKPRTYRYYITRLALKMSGFLSFYNSLPESLEKILRKKNMRVPGLWAPVLSATSSLLDDPYKNDPCERSTSLIMAAYELYSDINSGKLEPDHYKNSIFEMGLYPNLFFTSLNIKKNGVSLLKSKPKFRINVLVRRQFFILDLEKNGNFLSYNDIYLALKEIIIISHKELVKNETPSIGLITAANNSTQYKAFKILYKDKESKSTVSLLEKSFLTLCIDIDSMPSSYAEVAFFAHNTNHGNRWYHSATQLVVFGNGKSAIIYNFTAYIDGITMARASSELYSRALNFHSLNENPIKPKYKNGYTYQKLKWKFPQRYLKSIIKDIRFVSDSQQATFEIENYGRNFFSKYNIDSIPVFVIALSMTVKEFTSKSTSILQFVSMAKYCCMSLLTTDVYKKQVMEFTDIIENNNIDVSEKIIYLHKAIESQKAAIRKTRKELSIDILYLFYIHSKSGIKKLVTIFQTTIFSLLIGRISLFNQKKRDIVISHPSSLNTLPVFGRPGIRLPYVNLFGLHYQILDKKIIITMMPSLKWVIPNVEFINILSQKLSILASLISQS